MTDTSDKKSFWHTLPGIITAIAGLLGAVATLITALYTAGIIQGGPEEVSEGAGTSAGPSGTTAVEVTAPAAPPPVPPAAAPLMTTLQPVTQGMGRPEGLSGSLAKGSDRAFSPPEFGDFGRAKEVRGYISFDLSGLPSGAEVENASLSIAQGGGSGDLDPRYFSTVLLETVDIGSNLSGPDFGVNGQLVKRIALGSLVSAPHDVTDAIRLARLSGKRILTFRLRFSVGHNNDDQRDVWALSYDRGRTRLEVQLTR